MVTHEHLLELVEEGILPFEERVGWRPTAGEGHPHLLPGETVTFVDFHARGLGFPAHNFFHGLLNVLGIELQHLNPNGVLLLAGFMVV